MSVGTSTEESSIQRPGSELVRTLRLVMATSVRSAELPETYRYTISTSLVIRSMSTAP
jgi:hypothetical protein